jgi:hypothetical protein
MGFSAMFVEAAVKSLEAARLVLPILIPEFTCWN